MLQSTSAGQLRREIRSSDIISVKKTRNKYLTLWLVLLFVLIRRTFVFPTQNKAYKEVIPKWRPNDQMKMNETIYFELIRNDDNLSDLLNYIVQSYLLNFYSICILWNTEWHFNFRPSKNSSSNTMRVNSIKIKDNSFFESNLRDAMEANYCQVFIAFGNEIPIFLKAYERLCPKIQRRFSNYHFIFVSDNFRGEANEIINFTMFTDVPNILLVERINVKSFHLWTTNYNYQHLQNTNKILLLDTYDGDRRSFSKGASLFPNKLANLKRRSLALGVFSYKPYVVVKAPNIKEQSNIRIIKGSDNNGTYLDGTEGRLLLFFCEKYNCTLDVFVDEQSEWGAVYENYTGTGVLGNLLTRKVDVIVCALYLWYPEYRYFEYSVAISRTGITAVVPVPRRAVSWLLPFKPFSQILWLILIITILTISFLLGLAYVSRTGRIWLMPRGFFVTFRICLAQSTRILFVWCSDRIIVISCLLVGLIFTNIYSSGLSSILTFPSYEDAIDSKEDLLRKQQLWGATSNAWILSIQGSEVADLRNLVSNFRVLKQKELFKRGLTGQFGLAVERLPYGHYAAGDYITTQTMENLQIMLHDIYFEYCVLMSYKTWPLMDQFNDFILRLQQSGIQSVLEQEVVSKYANSQVQLQIAIKRQNARNGELRALSLYDTLGVFMVWIFGVFLSSLVFLAELKKRWKQLKVPKFSRVFFRNT